MLDALDGGLLDHVAAMGPILERGLREMVARLGIDAEVRGKGLMWGVDLGRDAGAVVPAALARGVVVNRTAGSVIRLLPSVRHHRSGNRRRPRPARGRDRGRPWRCPWLVLPCR